MAISSAGLLMYRNEGHAPEIFLVHPGGPYFKKKDEGWWTVPKGLNEPGESLLDTAIREFSEETGIIPLEPYFPLGFIKQKGGKIVHAWAFEGKWHPSDGLKCNTFKIEWPPRSGKFDEFPEVNKAGWFDIEEAKQKINQQQVPFLERLLHFL